MAKPVKLRVLISLLGLEPDVGKNLESKSLAAEAAEGSDGGADEGERWDANRIVWDLLTHAAEDEDEWVKAMAGLVRGKLFRRGEDPTAAAAAAAPSSCRDPECDRLMRKTTDGILKRVQAAATAAAADYAATHDGLLPSESEDDGDNENGEVNEDLEKEREEGRNRSLKSYLIVGDAAPLYAPQWYRILPPSSVRGAIPEADENPHFVADASASILRVDDKMERRKAEEESKELERSA